MKKIITTGLILLSFNVFSQDIIKYMAICSSIATFKNNELKSSTSYNAKREIIYSSELEYIKIVYPENDNSDFWTLGNIFDSDVENGYKKIYQKAYLKGSTKEEAIIFYWKDNKLARIQRCLTDYGTLFVTTFDIIN
jgi:hypothetical protein